MESTIQLKYNNSKQFSLFWWSSLTITEKEKICTEHFEILGGFLRNPSTLTGSEITKLFSAEIVEKNQILLTLLPTIEENIIALCKRDLATPFRDSLENPFKIVLQPVYVSEIDNSKPFIKFQSLVLNYISFTIDISQEQQEHIINNFDNVKLFFTNFKNEVIIEHYPELYIEACF